MSLPKVVVFFHHIGPYHHARLNAFAKNLQVIGIEWFARGSYDWGNSTNNFVYKKYSVLPRLDRDFLCRTSTLEEKLLTILSDFSPDIIVVNGWNNFGSLITIFTASKLSIPLVLMSDSTAYDSKRFFWKEALKRRILTRISTALVGGQLQRDYLIKLGIASDRILLGYDVVDNVHFEKGAAQSRQNSLQLRQQLELPKNFFLASARFIKVKNLPRLLDAYAQYRIQAGNNAWSLVLLGDGPLKSQLCHQIKQLNLTSWVHLPGFKQYDELPHYYGLANCFILASTSDTWGLVINEAMAAGLPVLVSNRCGCVPDLVQHGHNGYTFDPYNPNQLAELMLKISSGDCDLIAMGQASHAIIAQWTPQTFADSLQKAVEMAMTLPQKELSFFDHALLFALSRRSFLH